MRKETKQENKQRNGKSLTTCRYFPTVITLAMFSASLRHYWNKFGLSVVFVYVLNSGCSFKCYMQS